MIQMEINPKLQELIDQLFDKVKAKYPNITFKHLESSHDDRENIWVIVNADMDEDEVLEMREFSSQLEYHILMDHGYLISMMYDNPNAVLS